MMDKIVEDAAIHSHNRAENHGEFLGQYYDVENQVDMIERQTAPTRPEVKRECG